MNTSQDKPMTVAVIGGGISGLAAAWRLRELAPEANVILLEASERLGGVLETLRIDGFQIDRSSDSFITVPRWAADFCHRIGLGDQLIETRPTGRRAYVVRKGRLRPIPDGFQVMAPSSVWAVLSSPVLSPLGKLRLCCEFFVPRRDKDAPEESLAEFASRRFGSEVYQRLVQPLVSGIYTADPSKLSVAATLPRFLELEEKYGSLTRGLRGQRAARRTAASEDGGARYSMFVSLRGGMISLVEAIANGLPADTVRLNTRVQSVAREGAEWRLAIEGQDEPLHCDRLVIAAPAPKAADLLKSCDAALAADLEKIQYAGCAVVCLGYGKDQLPRPLDGFGFVVPSIERRRLLSASYASEKFVGRAPEDAVLIRVFIGGAVQQELMQSDDDELQSIARAELEDLLGVRGAPRICHIARWEGTMPQYHVGHVALVQRIEQRVRELKGLAVTGNAYYGVGVPHCIHRAEQAVERLLEVTEPD